MWQATALGPGSNKPAGQTPAEAAVGTNGSDSDQVCIPNISFDERRVRLIAGVVQFGVGLAILAVLIALGANRWWRLALFLPFGGAAAGFFQWRDKT
jgi:hypothetical protein